MSISCSNPRAAKCRTGVLAGLIGLTLVASRTGAQTAPAPSLPAAPSGKALYQRWCSGCHGDSGAGDGYAAQFMLPRPRDLTLANFHIRTTRSGDLPTDADIRRAIEEGLPGTAMGGWKEVLTVAAVDTLVGYIKTLSPFFSGPPPSPLPIGAEPTTSPEGIAEGQRVYQRLKCAECHGVAGRGDGTSVPTLVDDQKMPIRTTDLTKNWLFRGGGSVREIYRGFRTGLNGTPMPAFTAEANGVSDEQLWRLAQYVRSLSPDQPPAAEKAMHAAFVEGTLPANPDDPVWNQASSYYVPLAGQVMVKPRWFAPSIDGVWVQAMHNNQRLTIKLTWHDASRSPNPAFDPWLKKMAETMDHADPPPITAQGPDRFAVVLPVRIGADSLRPHFLSGNSARPAYAWRWSSTPDTAEEATTRGLARFVPLAKRSALAHVARFDNGEWQLQLTRPFVPADSTAAPTFSTDQPVPVAFFAADGSSGETGTRGSMSGWYTIMLHMMAADPERATR